MEEGIGIGDSLCVVFLVDSVALLYPTFGLGFSSFGWYRSIDSIVRGGLLNIISAGGEISNPKEAP